MRHGSLFSGIGGFDLAAEWMGWENVFHCEWNEVGQKILKHYWPNAKSYGDITKTDFTVHRGNIDIITGGFPCQPYSVAGNRKGKEDDRHLWPEMLRAIRQIQPRWIVGENVPGLLNWNGGMVLDEIKADLEAAGFEVFPPCVLPACGLNAPHRRDRVWIVAYSTSSTEGSPRENRKTESYRSENNDEQSGGRIERKQYNGCGNVLQFITNSECIRQSEQGGAFEYISTKESRDWKASWAYNDGRWPLESPLCNGNDGLSSQLDGITFSKWRQESIKGAGNAIVPQVAYEIFKAIEQVE